MVWKKLRAYQKLRRKKERVERKIEKLHILKPRAIATISEQLTLDEMKLLWERLKKKIKVRTTYKRESKIKRRVYQLRYIEFMLEWLDSAHEPKQ
jgi:transcriptional accessory protein Tex/SPT6